jgi:hypothetical protein
MWMAKGQSCSSSSCSVNSCEYICNGSFEYNTGNPTAQNQVSLTCGWTNADVTTTPDYFTTAGTTGSFNIPCNYESNTASHTGTAYVGFLAHYGNPFAESITADLKTSLTLGHTYKISFWLSLSSGSLYNTNDNVGVRLGEKSTVHFAPDMIVNTSTQTTAWTQYTIAYTPTDVVQEANINQIRIGALASTLNQTSYTTTATNCSGTVSIGGTRVNDTYYFLEDVSITEIITPTITVSSASGCVGETFTLTATGADSYTWNPGGLIGASVAVTPTATTIYTVTGTTTGSCSVVTQTVSISTYSCCQNPNTGTFTVRDANLVAYGTGGAIAWTSLTTGGYYTGAIAIPSTGVIQSTFAIAKSLTISTTVTFSLCNISVTEDAPIYQNGQTTIRRSWIYGCDKLWEGINSTARLEVYDSFIEDAYIGMKITSGGTHPGLICDNVVFDKNYFGIAASGTITTFNTTGCIFTSRTISSGLHDFTPPRYTTSLAPISGKTPAKLKGSTSHSITVNTIRSYYGIYLTALTYTSGDINIGETSGTPTTNASYTNYYDYLNCGIYNLWSRVFIRNNSFGNMINTGVGNAIGGVVHDDTPFLLIDKVTSSKIGDPSGGVYKNVFNIMKDGVAAINGGTLDISGNDFITVNRYGVSVSTWSSSASPLEPVTVASNSYTDCLYPFYAYDNNYIKCSVRSNTVTHVQPTYTAGYCAYIDELSKPANATYSITANVYSGMLNGIYLTNVSGARIVSNTVTIKKPGTGIFNAGVTLDNTDNTILSDNILSCNPTNSGSWYTFGILASTAASNTLQCNTITKSGICIKFQGTGSPNYIHDNSLNQTSTTDPCLFGVVLDQGANIGNIGLYESSTWKQSRDVWGDFLYGSPNNGADTYVYGSPLASTGGNIYYDASASPTGDYTPGVNLFSAPSTSFTPSPNTNSNGFNCGIGARLMNTGTNGGKGIDGHEQPLPVKKRIILQNGNENNRNIGSNIAGSNVNAFNEVDSLFTSYRATRNVSDLNTAKSTNAGITPSNNIEQNQKDFNAIYAVYIEDDSLVTPNQIQDLVTMSKLCPFTDGLAVYQARGLMRRWDDSTFFYNDCEHNAPTQEEHARRIANSLTGANVITEVYPNPANSSVMVKTNLNSCSIEIYDVIGKHILSQKLNENETKIDVTSFNNGTYLYKIADSSNKVIKNGKLIVNH